MRDFHPKVFITERRQVTSFDADELMCFLEEDEKIFAFDVRDISFAILIRDGITFGVLETEEEARNFIADFYKDYKLVYIKNGDLNSECDISDYEVALTKKGEFLGKFEKEEDAWRAMYRDSGAEYRYVL